MAGIKLWSFGHYQGPFHTTLIFDDKIYLVCSRDPGRASLIILTLRDIRFHISTYQDSENNTRSFSAQIKYLATKYDRLSHFNKKIYINIYLQR